MSKISVVIPSEFSLKEINEMIQGIIIQTIPDWEIILPVRKNSDALEEYNEFKKISDQILVCFVESDNFADQVNHGIREASGDYIAIITPYDDIRADMYRTLVFVADKYQLDAVLGVNEKKQEIDWRADDPDQALLNTIACPAEDARYFRKAGSVGSGIYRRSFLLESGIFLDDSSDFHSAELGFRFRVLATARKLMLLDLPVYRQIKKSDETDQILEYSDFEKEFRRIYQSLICCDEEKRNELAKGFTILLNNDGISSFEKFDHWNLLRNCEKFSEDLKEYTETGWIDTELLFEQEKRIFEVARNDPQAFYQYITRKKNSERDYLKTHPPVPIYQKQSSRYVDEKQIPRLSVIIPIYNTEKYLEECIDSVLNQDVEELEIICVNDGSTDSSLSIAERYAAKDDRFAIISKENGGLSSARNMGIQAAHGDYIHFMDSDDILEKGSLKVILKQAEKADLDMILFDIACSFDTEGERMDESLIEQKNRYYSREKYYSGIFSGINLYEELRKNDEYFSSACCYLTKRSHLFQHQCFFWEGIIIEDELFTIQNMVNAEKVAYSGIKAYRRRLRPNSIVTSKVSMKNIRGYYIDSLALKYLLCSKEKELGKKRGLFKKISNLEQLAITNFRRIESNELIEPSDWFEELMIQDIRNAIGSETYLKKEIEKQKKTITKLQVDISDIYHSRSYRLGNKVMEPLHKWKVLFCNIRKEK